MRILLVVIVCFILAACQPGQSSDQLSVASNLEQDEGQNGTEDTIAFTSNNVILSVTKPAKWESFTTESGIVIGERFGSVATAGVLEGLMTYIFISPLEDFTIDADTSANIAQSALDQILADPVYTSTVTHTGSTAFNWGDYPAAYYLITGDDGNATIVIGVAFPSERVLLSCSVSAPYEQRQRIREMLPELLHGLEFNDVVLSGEALDSLPETFDFPLPQ